MNDLLQRILTSKHKATALAALVIFSFAWIVYDGSRLSILAGQAHKLALLGLCIAFTEACFMVGAILMAMSLGIGISTHEGRIRGWYKHVRYVRREVKTLARNMLQNKLFA